MKRRLPKYEFESLFDFGFFDGTKVGGVYQGSVPTSFKILRETLLLRELIHADLGDFDDLLKVIKVEGKSVFAIELSPIKNLTLSMMKSSGIPFSTESANFWYLFSVEKKSDAITQEVRDKLYPFILTLGHPEYLSWCINNVDSFCLSENAIKSIQANKYLSKVNFSHYTVGNNMYFRPSTIQSSYSFPPKVLQNNSKKQAT